MHALQRMQRAGNERARAIQTMTRTLGERGGTMADDPVRRRTRRAAERIERQHRNGSSLGPAGVGMSVFSEAEIGYLQSKTMGAIEIRGDAEPHFKSARSAYASSRTVDSS
jgi:hypothetical protein